MTLLRARYAKVERIVDDLLKRADVTAAPVNVNKLAKLVDAVVRYEDFDDDVSGVLVRSADSNVIGVQRRQSKVRQRFTIAHEIGHLLLHEGAVHVDKAFRINWRKAELEEPKKIEEIEANHFAASLLMPRVLLERAHGTQMFDLEDETEAVRLAALFQVSKQAMTFRLFNLFERAAA